MTQALDSHTALALLNWQLELGATEAICDAPVDRYSVPERLQPPKTAASATPATSAEPAQDAVADSKEAARGATDLNALQAALGAYEHCALKRGARNLVFSDGHASARVMFIGEAPGRDEDLQGKPFVGRAGQLLDRMLAAIELDRRSEDPAKGVYITNVLPWRPPQNRDPEPLEIAMMRPFMQRHVDLVNPDVVVLMGNISCYAGIGKRGITRLRGTWAQAYGKPALLMFHPAYLLRNPAAKRQAWADLLELKARLEEAS